MGMFDSTWITKNVPTHKTTSNVSTVGSNNTDILAIITGNCFMEPDKYSTGGTHALLRTSNRSPETNLRPKIAETRSAPRGPDTIFGT